MESKIQLNPKLEKRISAIRKQLNNNISQIS